MLCWVSRVASKIQFQLPPCQTRTKTPRQPRCPDKGPLGHVHVWHCLGFCLAGLGKPELLPLLQVVQVRPVSTWAHLPAQVARHSVVKYGDQAEEPAGSVQDSVPALGCSSRCPAAPATGGRGPVVLGAGWGLWDHVGPGC